MRQVPKDDEWRLKGSTSLPSLVPAVASAGFHHSRSNGEVGEHQAAQLALLDAKKRLVRAQRLARKQSIHLALEETRNSKLQAAREFQAELAKLTGKATKSKLAGVSKASQSTMQQISDMCNEAMAERYAGQGGISPTCLWYRFFSTPLLVPCNYAPAFGR